MEDTMRNFNQLDIEMTETDLNFFDEEMEVDYGMEEIYRDSSTTGQTTEAVYSETYNELSF